MLMSNLVQLRLLLETRLELTQIVRRQILKLSYFPMLASKSHPSYWIVGQMSEAEVG